MLISLKDRQGFNTGLSGVSGTSIQSAFTKPLIEPVRGASNVSWLPFPYGPLPDTGPWASSGDQNEKEEHPTPETPTEAQPWKGKSAATLSNGFYLVLAVVCAWFLTKKGGF